MLTLDQPVLYISKDWNSYFEDLSYSDYLGPFHLYNSFVASPEEGKLFCFVFFFKRKEDEPAVKFTFPGEALWPIFLILQQRLKNHNSSQPKKVTGAPFLPAGTTKAQKAK